MLGHRGSSWALKVGRSDLPPGQLGISNSQIGRSYSAKLRHFCQLRCKLAIIHTIAIKWKEKYDAVVADCHHNLCFCGDRTKMGFPKKKYLGRLPLLPGSHLRQNFDTLGRQLCPSGPLAYSLGISFFSSIWILNMDGMQTKGMDPKIIWKNGPFKNREPTILENNKWMQFDKIGHMH